MHSTTHDKSDEKENDFDTSSEEEEEEDVSCDTDDGLPRCIRMTFVTYRGKQVYSHPNEVKTHHLLQTPSHPLHTLLCRNSNNHTRIMPKNWMMKKTQWIAPLLLRMAVVISRQGLRFQMNAFNVIQGLKYQVEAIVVM
eukprot:261890_1